MNPLRSASLLLLVLATVCSAAKVDTSRFQYRIDLPIPPDPPMEDLFAFRLPPALFRDTQDSLADLRIVGADLGTVPFKITRRTEVTRETHRVAVSSHRIGYAEEPSSNRIALVFECTNRPTGPTGFTLHTPLRNYEKQVAVEAGSDGTNWINLVSGATVFDASRFVDVARNEVTFPENPFRFFRIVLYDVTELQSSPVSEIARFIGAAGTGDVQRTDRTSQLNNRDFRVDRIDFWRQEVSASVTKPRIIPYPATNLTVRTDDKKRQTVVRFESGRAPVTRIGIQTSSKNFSRSYVLVEDDPNRRFDEPRRVLARGNLHQFDFRSLHQSALTIELPETRCSGFELTIENGDSPELAIDGVSLDGPEMQALFFAKAGESVLLYFGDPEAKQPAFDTFAIDLALDRGLPGRLITHAADVEPNPDRAGAPGFRFNMRALLLGAMVIMVLVLGAALFKAARRIDSDGGG